VDFGVGGGDQTQGSVDVVGFDGERVLSGSAKPGGLGQEAKSAGVSLAGFGEQIDGGGSEDVTVGSGAGDVPLEVSGEGFARQRGQGGGGADAAEQRALDAETRAAEQVVVAQEDEGEGAAVAAAEAQEQGKRQPTVLSWSA
jgi:hypothetical protein